MSILRVIPKAIVNSVRIRRRSAPATKTKGMIFSETVNVVRYGRQALNDSGQVKLGMGSRCVPVLLDAGWVQNPMIRRDLQSLHGSRT